MEQHIKVLYWLSSARKALKAIDTLGIATPKPDKDLVRERLKTAEAHAKGEV
jgi:hypothetical protein